MTLSRVRTRAAILLGVTGIGLAFAGSALAHANVSPAVVLAKSAQVFALAVPTEKENAFTTQVQLTPPSGFSIDSFAPAPSWKRQAQTTGTGEETVVQRVTWTGRKVPTGEDAFFQFLASTDSARTYDFKVRQTYSDGSVVDWSGPESSDAPAPSIEARSSLGGGGASNTLAIVALALGALALVVAVGGRQPPPRDRPPRPGRPRSRRGGGGPPRAFGEALPGVSRRARIAFVLVVVGGALVLPAAAWAHGVPLHTTPLPSAVVNRPPPV